MHAEGQGFESLILHRNDRRVRDGSNKGKTRKRKLKNRRVRIGTRNESFK